MVASTTTTPAEQTAPASAGKPTKPSVHKRIVAGIRRRMGSASKPEAAADEPKHHHNHTKTVTLDQATGHPELADRVDREIKQALDAEESANASTSAAHKHDLAKAKVDPMSTVPSGHPEMADQVASEITEAFAIADRDPMTLVPDGHPALADQVTKEISEAFDRATVQLDLNVGPAETKHHKAPGTGWDKAVGHPELADRVNREIAEAIAKDAQAA